jgi:hypothetical protein
LGSVSGLNLLIQIQIPPRTGFAGVVFTGWCSHHHFANGGDCSKYNQPCLYILFVSNDMFVIIALPQQRAASFSQGVDGIGYADL